MIKEFKAFIMRGNVVDMAVGIVVGAAFGKIVASLVNDVLLPPIGLLIGGVDFSNLFITLRGESFPTLAAAQAAGAPTLRYGVFINSLVDFLIVSAAIFMVVKAMNRLRKGEVAVPKEITTKPCLECLSEIPIAAKRCAHCGSPVQP
ncbi:MAG: large-conductance mechanosensitive channel protein MscL [Nitrospirae bacterium]|nr:large-conductance mechanosensitive channel protein MscL [Nitrospirota bacterium]